uniref:PDZ domain-containing protein n=1 Tax=Hemiselmis andersenii TaxID=464988 RepID=A0A6U4LMG1_HEMAN|mmetsp:Transcript_20586/g.47565  ORF Transcript_20586/g.47565 Transcript_20586/m.47565 type:complete len:166 (+) Transcript_20586:246-743(+)
MGDAFFGLDKIFACCDCRQDRMHTPGYSINGGSRLEKVQNAPVNVCGVGINFRADKTGALVVNSVVQDGPAENHGGVFPGDTLLKVNGELVIRKPLSVVSSLLLGPPNTNVLVTFQRGEEEVEVELTRNVVKNLMTVQAAPPISSAAKPYNTPPLNPMPPLSSSG